MAEDTTYVINTTEKPCSYEFGKASSRYKLYFKDAADLKKQIDDLIALGLYTIEEIRA